jgi:hypothetical protein
MAMIPANFAGCVAATCLALMSPVANMPADPTKAVIRATGNTALATERCFRFRTYQAETPRATNAPAVRAAATVWRYRGTNEALNAAAKKSVRRARPSMIS